MRRPHIVRGFTLVELMISIAIALLLIVGINQVFRAASQATGAGNALLTATRDARTVEQTFQLDMKEVVDTVAGGAACFIIRSEHVYAFRNSRDFEGAADPADASNDPNVFTNTMTPAGKWPLVMTNNRSHRVDKFAFFVRDVFPMQTSWDDKNYVSNASGTEAWVVYGHARLPNNASINAAYKTPAAPVQYYNPGEINGTPNLNDTNFSASDWLLSRVAIILNADPTDPKKMTLPAGTTPATVNFLATNNPVNPTAATAVDLTPLSNGLLPTGGTKSRTGNFLINDCRLDLAQTSIANYKIVLNGLAATNANWFDQLIGYRFEVSPVILPDPKAPPGSTAKATSYGLAKCAPCLIRGCSQFIVEYAGNFYTKDPVTGAVVDATKPDPSGALDFYSYIDPVTSKQSPPQVRWYGFPRDTNGDRIIDEKDVIPLRDVVGAANAPHEKFSAGFPPNYSGNAYYAIGPSSTLTYTAAWGVATGNSFPSMIRISIAIDDPNGRLADPQWYEFVFSLKSGTN